MDVRLLGSIEVRDRSGTPVELRQRKVLVLLAMLASRSPEAVTVDELVEALWPTELPARPSAALQTYVSRLRAALGEPNRVRRRGEAYLLDLGADESDLACFAQLADEGRVALASGDPLTAATRLREALRLFRGPPFAELTYEECLQPGLRRLERQRIDVLADRIDADLRLGRHDACVAELQALVVAHPSVERFARQLAQARSGSDDAPVPSGTTAPLRETHRPLPGALAAVRTGPFIGRREALNHLTAHHGGLAVVVGEPGIGKTRLVAEAAHMRADRGSVVWFGRCDERSLWFFEPFVEMLDDALERLGPTAAQLLVQFPDLGRLVPDRAARAGAPLPVPVDAQTAQRLTATAVAQLARAVAAEGELTVVIDDLHWADAGTARLVALLVDEPDGNISVIVTVREPGGPPGAAPFGDRDVVTEVRLGGLTPAEVTELAEMVDGDGVVPAGKMAGSVQIVRADGVVPEGAVLHERTGGNPLFVRALVGEHGDGVQAPPSPGSGTVDTTATMRTVIERRVGALEGGAGDALALAAVIGNDVPVQLVTAVGGPHAGHGLDQAATAGLLRGAGTPGHCAFVHGLVRDVVYDGLGPARRQRLHLAVAEALQVDLPDGGDGTEVAVAAHLGASGDRQARARGVGHASAAARRALADHRFEEAARRFDLALELVDDPRDVERTGLLLVGRATALRRAGTPDAPDAITEAIEVARRGDDPFLLADAVLLLADRRPDAEVVEYHDEALSVLAGEAGPEVDSTRARLLVAKGWHLAERDPVAAGEAVARGRRVAEEHSVVAAMAHAQSYEWEMTPLDRPPDRRLADAAALVEVAATAADHQSELTAHHLRANALVELGELAAAEHAIAAGDRLAGVSQMPAQLAIGAQHRAMRAILRGELDEAERHAGDALTLMGADPSYAPIYLGQLCAIRSLQGRPHGLAELIETDATNRDRPVAVAARAGLHARCGDADQARRLLDSLVGRGLDAVPRDSFWTVTMALAADAAVITGHRELASLLRPRLQTRAGYLVVFGYGAVCWGAVERFTAPLAVMLDDLAAGRDDYRWSLAVHTRIDARPFAAHDQLGLAAVLDRLDEEPEQAEALRVAGRGTLSALDLATPVLP